MSLVLNYSITPQILDSHTKDEANKIAWGWKTASTPWEENKIKELLTTKSIAPGIFTGSHKLIKNVTGYQHIMLDFDSIDNIPPQEMINSLRAKYPETAFAVFASTNHMVDYHKNNLPILGHSKYRVLFPLERPLNKAEVEAMNFYFLDTYSKIDASTFMLARYFFRGNDKVWFFNSGRTYLNTNIIINEVNHIKKVRKIVTYLKPDMVITDDRGNEHEIKDITSKIVCHCPFHDDLSPSAFVDLTPTGSVMLFCSSCQANRLGTDEKGNYYIQNPKPRAENIKLFFNSPMHAACHIHPNGDIEKINAGTDWINFCAGYGIDPSVHKHLPRAKLGYNPQLPNGLLPEHGIFNKYKHSKYIQHYKNKITNSYALFKSKAPVTAEILMNLCGTEEIVEYVLNWFGYLLQTGKQINTALIFQNSRGGIGKDLLFRRVWVPIFGEDNTRDEIGASIGERFTSQYAFARLVRFDECFTARDTNSNTTRLQWLKSRITGKRQPIEAKGQDKTETDHFCAYILHSNSEMAISIERFDRRFVVIENNKSVPIINMPWYTSQVDLELQISNEVDIIAEYILSITINEELANTAIETAAKSRLQHASTQELSAFAYAMKEKDVDYFEIEDALERDPLVDKLSVPSITKIITDMIRLYSAIPTTYIDALIKHKTASSAAQRRHLSSYKVVNDGQRITMAGKQYRVYRYVD